MQKAILNRYLLLEVSKTWLAVITVLLAIMLSTRFARYLGKAASGEIPQTLLLQVVTLSSLQYLMILVPISFMLAIMLSMGRMYRDHEIAAISACGVGLTALYRPYMQLALLLALLTGYLSIYAGPLAGRTLDFLTRQAQSQVSLTLFEAGQFSWIPDSYGVFYAEEKVTDQSRMDGIFVAYVADGQWTLVTAKNAVQQVSDDGTQQVVLVDGQRNDNLFSNDKRRRVDFEQHGLTVSQSDFVYRPRKTKLKSTESLLSSDHPDDVAELQWRISAPMVVMLLALIAVPLAHTTPRQGRYGKVVLGILVYIAYSNLLGLSQAWIEKEKISPLIGMWWVHIVMFGIALVLLFRRLGWFSFRGLARRLRPVGQPTQVAS